MSALAAIRDSPGLDAYLEELEARLEAVVTCGDGRVSLVGLDALAAGGKRLRPLLVYMSAPERPNVAAGAAVELLHLATLIHDDLIDGAELRRGRPAAWFAYGSDTARAAGDALFARAFAELAAADDSRGVAVLAQAALSLVRGEALQRLQLHRSDTTVEAYIERCTLKTATLFETACLLGSGRPELGAFGRNLGLAFQIVDDILDCAGETIETGKVAGTDLREGTPTLPLLLAARQDAVVREALAGGPLEGALVRVAATGALERSREVALDYARKARVCLGAAEGREGLEALTHIVIDRRY